MLIRRSRSLLKVSSASYRSSTAIAARPPRLPRNPLSDSRTSRTCKRLASSAKTGTVADGEKPSTDADAVAAIAAAPLDEPPSDEVDKSDSEKPKRRTKTSKDSDPPQLPTGLNIIWEPELDSSDASSSQSLPPPEILDEALNNLHITQHPQTQHRACYPSTSSPIVEPTLALYCPIEGGEYVIDETVRELARRTGSDVVVVDAVQLAAGEWGHFGKGALITLMQRLYTYIEILCSCQHYSAASKSSPFSSLVANCTFQSSSIHNGRGRGRRLLGNDSTANDPSNHDKCG